MLALGLGADDSTIVGTIYEPALRELLGADNADVAPLQLGEALRRLLVSIAEPVVLIIEDIHWADADTLAALDYLVDHIADESIMLVATMRDAQSPAASSIVARWVVRRVGERLDLPLLDRGETRTLLSACLGAPAPDLFVEAVIGATDGNPFLVEEYLHDAVERGDLAENKGAWSYRVPASVLVPTSFQHAIADRMVSLKPAAHDVIGLASMIGRDVHVELLADLGIDRASALLAVGEGVKAQLLEQAPNSTGYRFRHALTQDAVMATLLDSERRRIAGAASTSLTEGGLASARLDVAATLARLSGDEASAFELHLAAADRAIAVGAVASAFGHLDPAGELAGGERSRLTRVTECRVHALALAGRAAEAMSVGQLLVAEFRSSGEHQRLRRVLLALARANGGAGDWVAAAKVLDDDWQAGVLPEIWSYRAVAAIELGDDEWAARLADETLASPAASPVSRCEAHEVLGRLARRNSYTDAAVHFRRGVDVASEHGLGLWRGRALLELGLSEATLHGRPDAFEQALETATEQGAMSLAAMTGYNLSNLTGGFLMEPNIAADIAREAAEIATRIDSGKLTALAWLSASQADGLAGRRGAARVAADKARQAAPNDPEIAALAVGMAEAWPTLIADGAAAAADLYGASLEGLLALPVQTTTSPWYWGPIALSVAGREDLTARALAVVDTMRAAPLLELTVSACDAIEAGRRGDEAAVARSLSVLDDFMATHPLMNPQVRSVQLLAKRGVAEAALTAGWGDPVTWLREAEEYFASRGLEVVARSCANLLRSAGESGRTRGRSQLQRDVPKVVRDMGVTDRELDVLALLGRRMTNPEIAVQLSISPRTVKSHVEHLLAKTGRVNRFELGELAVETDLS